MRRKILIVVITLPLLLVAVTIAYLHLGNLGWARGMIEHRVGEALSRELTIAGEFTLEVLPTLHLVAGDVTLGNPGWSAEPSMIQLERVELTIDLWSVWSAPVVVRDLQIESATIRLESDAEGRANWDFGFEERPELKLKPDERRVIFESSSIRDLELTYGSPSRDQPLLVAVDRFETGLDEEKRTDRIELEGSVDSYPVSLSGSITALSRLIDGEPLQYDLHGRGGRIELESHGEIADVASLGGPDLEIRVRGPDLEAVTELLELPSLGNGAFEMISRVTPSSRGVELMLDADLVDLQAEAHGYADSLADTQDLKLDVRLSGKNLSATGYLFGLKNLPPEEFEATGRLAAGGGRVELEQLSARVGKHAASVQGVVSTAPELFDQELRFEAAGPALSTFGPAIGLELPQKSYRLAGHFIHRDDRIAVEQIEGRVGRVKLDMSGMVDEVFRFAGADLDFLIAGPELHDIRFLSEVDLPKGPFELAGNLKASESALALAGVHGHAGETTLDCDGTLSLTSHNVGSDFRVKLTGDDPSWLRPMTGLTELAMEPYAFDGNIRVTESGYEFRAVEGTFGDDRFELDGRFGLPSDPAALELDVRASGPDLSRLIMLGLPEGLPTDPYELDGRLRVTDDATEFADFAAMFGSIELELKGRLGDEPDYQGTDLELKIQGPDVSALSAYAELPPLPVESFSATAHLVIDDASYRLGTIAGKLGQHRFTVDGTLLLTGGLVGSDVRLELSGPDLADALRLAGEAGVEDLPEMPARRYSLEGELAVEETGYRLRQVLLRVGEAEAHVAGRLGPPPEYAGTDLSFDAQGPDSSIVGGMVGVELPQEPLGLHGRVEREESGLRFHGLRIDLGSHHGEIDGALGEPPGLAGTNLDVRIQGPDLSLFSALVRPTALPDEPYEISAHLDGTPEQFRMRRFSASLGGSDLSGELEVDLRAKKPVLDGEFRSKRFDLIELLFEEKEVEGLPQITERTRRAKKKTRKQRTLLSDEPIDFDVLDSLDGRVRWQVDELRAWSATLSDFDLAAELRDGRLTIDPVTAAGNGGIYALTMSAEPFGDEYRLHAAAKAENARISLLPYVGDPSHVPAGNLEIELTGEGRSLHGLASSLDGSVLLAQGPGRIDNSILTKIAADPLSKLFVTLNPFSKRDPFTSLECSVLSVTLEGGVARLGPLVMRTNKMVMVGRGQIDLATEKLRVNWATKPRKGVGLSASTITNSYIKIGGSLSEPSLALSPLRAARTTGAAAMTGGLWLLYKGVFNRVSAERQLCRAALKRVEKNALRREKRKG